jgi:hypothetical protein
MSRAAVFEYLVVLKKNSENSVPKNNSQFKVTNLVLLKICTRISWHSHPDCWRKRATVAEVSTSMLQLPAVEAARKKAKPSSATCESIL